MPIISNIVFYFLRFIFLDIRLFEVRIFDFLRDIKLKTSFFTNKSNNRISNDRIIYFTRVIVPVFSYFWPVSSTAVRRYAYTPIGTSLPFILPSQPFFGSLLSKTIWPQRFKL